MAKRYPEQQVREVEAQLRLVEEGPRKEKISQMEARVLMQQEAVNHIRDRLDKFTVRAYFDGYVTEELTEWSSRTTWAICSGVRGPL